MVGHDGADNGLRYLTMVDDGGEDDGENVQADDADEFDDE